MELEDELQPGDEDLVERLRAARRTPAPAARNRIMAAVRSAPTAGHGAATRGRGWTRRSAASLALASVLLVGATSAAVAASADAVPGSPGYGLRQVGEGLRLDISGPGQRVGLRTDFARSRLEQAGQSGLNHEDRATLLHDASSHLSEASHELGNLDDGARDQASRQIDDLQAQENQIQAQLNQGGGDPHPGGPRQQTQPGQGSDGNPGPNGSSTP